MYEEYDSETMFARYDKGANTVKLEWKKEASGDAYRTPLMHAAELIRKHGCDTMIIDASKLGKIPEADKTWTVKVFEPALKKSGLEEVIFVGKDLGEDFKGKIKRKTVPTMEEAEQLIRKEAHPSAGKSISDFPQMQTAPPSMTSSTSLQRDTASPRTRTRSRSWQTCPQHITSPAAEEMRKNSANWHTTRLRRSSARRQKTGRHSSATTGSSSCSAQD